jgi:uncharacterized protein YkwD
MFIIQEAGMRDPYRFGWLVSSAAGCIWIAIVAGGSRLKADELGPKQPRIEARGVSLERTKSTNQLPAPDLATLNALLKLHNEVRARQGLAALKLHPKLTAAAQRYAEFSFRTGGLGHQADGRSPDERIAAEGLKHGSWAENMAWGQPTPQAVMATWLKSNGHRGNILSRHSHVGFGKAGGVWVTVFANVADIDDADPDLVRK